MRSAALSIVLSLFMLGSFAQGDSSRYVHQGLWRAMATISPSVDPNASNIYIHGNLEYYADETVSARGDGYYYIGSFSKTERFEFNHSLFAGASYHFKTKNRFDPYLALQPGLSLTRPSYITDCPVGITPEQVAALNSNAQVNPLLSSAIGFNYYGERFFHLFGEIRYVHGKHLSPVPVAISLNELRASFGLGFNIN